MDLETLCPYGLLMPIVLFGAAKLSLQVLFSFLPTGSLKKRQIYQCEQWNNNRVIGSSKIFVLFMAKLFLFEKKR